MQSKYKKIKLKKGKTKDQHRLIMEAHLGRILSKNEVVHHIDEDKSNNSLSNLTIMSRSEHSKLHMSSPNRKFSNVTIEKLRMKGIELKPKAKLTIEQVKEIKIKLTQGSGLTQLGKEYGVDKTNIYQIKVGKIYSYVI
jgi:hypothetical protein